MPLRVGQRRELRQHRPCASPSGPIHDADGTVQVTSQQLKNLDPGADSTISGSSSPTPTAISSSTDRTFKPQGPPHVSDALRLRSQHRPGAAHGDHRPGGSGHPLPHRVRDHGRLRPELSPAGLQTRRQPVTDRPLRRRSRASCPGTTYHYRFVAYNSFGTADSGDQLFTTYMTDVIDDHCPNAHVRRQTLTSLLLDCRAYELVSAADAGGYDVAVRPDPRPGRAPRASAGPGQAALLAAQRQGPRRRRGRPTSASTPTSPPAAQNGWTTSYVGIPRTATPSTDAVRLAARRGRRRPHDLRLRRRRTSAAPASGRQGRASRCACPTAAWSRAWPARSIPAPGGEPPATSARPSPPTARTSSSARRRIRARRQLQRRRHDLRPRPRGRRHRGRLQDARRDDDDRRRDRRARPLRRRLAGPDRPAGRRRLGQNHYWHLYMNIGGAASTVDVTPGVGSAGVLFDGMTADGTRVFFTTTAALPTPARRRRHERRHLRSRRLAGWRGRAEPRLDRQRRRGRRLQPVADALQRPLERRRGGRRTAAPSPSPAAPGSPPATATIYFLSPEALDGSGTPNQPNLFVKRPGSPAESVARSTAGQPGDQKRRPRQREQELRRLPGHPERRPRGLRLAPLADRLPQLRPLRDLPLRRLPGGLDCVSCAPSGSDGDGRRGAERLRPQPHRRRLRLLHHPGPARAPGLEQEKGRLRVEGRRRAADLHRQRRLRLGPRLGQRRRRRRVLLHAAGPRRPRTRTATPSRSTTPGPTAASPSTRRRFPARPRTSATAPAARRPRRPTSAPSRAPAATSSRRSRRKRRSTAEEAAAQGASTSRRSRRESIRGATRMAEAGETRAISGGHRRDRRAMRGDGAARRRRSETITNIRSHPLDDPGGRPPGLRDQRSRSATTAPAIRRGGPGRLGPPARGPLRQSERGRQLRLRRLRAAGSARPTPRSAWSWFAPTTAATTRTCSARRRSTTWTRARRTRRRASPSSPRSPTSRSTSRSGSAPRATTA